MTESSPYRILVVMAYAPGSKANSPKYLHRTLVLISGLALCWACSTETDGGIGSDSGSPTPVDMGEPAELSGITSMHNDVRRMVGVPDLEWDPALAAVAQAWADECRDNDAPSGLIDHNSGRSDDYPGYVGENVYGSSGAASAQGAVDSWAGEEADYDYDNNTCSGVCGHYTQVVWAESQKLGCGISSCAGLRFGNAIVCNYSPGGNINGRRPY